MVKNTVKSCQNKKWEVLGLISENKTQKNVLMTPNLIASTATIKFTF